MISDKERRRAVAELRKASTGAYRHVDALDVIANSIGVDIVGKFDYEAEKETYAAIADLIDRPTCRNVSGYQDVFECSECRCRVDLITEVCNEHGEPFSVPLIPSWCPNCGAEVVIGDE